MRNDLISVIVPIYNVELYLQKCIDSILNQTYSNLEIILVDDGSTDSSSIICDMYLEKDNRIKVIHKKNGGLSNARNIGVKNAQGKYVAFIDSDDYISEDYIESLYRLICEYSADISVCRFRYVFGDVEDQIDGKKKEFKYDKIEALKVLFLEREFGHYAHQKLFSKELAEKYPYPENTVYEDVANTYLKFEDAKVVAYTQRQLYFYRQRPGSIISQINKTNFDVIDHVDEIQNHIKENLPEILSYTEGLKVFYYLHTLARLPYEDKFEFLRAKIKKYIRENRWKLMKSNKISRKLKIQLLLSIFGEKTYKKVWQKKEIKKQNLIRKNMGGFSK